jgi:hypothetical protein
LVGLLGAGQLQRAGQAGVVAHQRGWLFGAYPPHGVELRPIPEGVLDRQRGLAHPTSTVQRLGDRGCRALFKLLGQLSKDLLAAGERGVAAEGEVPHRRQRGRESGPSHLRRRRAAGEHGLGWQRPLAAHCCGQLLPQPRPCGGLVQADQVDVDHRTQQPLRLARSHPHQHQRPLLAGGVGGQPLRPLLPHIRRLKRFG